ncbi:MAG: large-conductance mechanosensitive channel protein MscL [Candidatus Pacebacteria bacterium]|nr:large-conductance mechanosensitive channel protein MscL [Candidatus Paceibacterota bacterium]
MGGFIKEFKAFAIKGNIFDLAVAVIVGTAFGKIVSSLVENIVMPLIGLFMQGTDFSRLSYSVGDAVITYGEFIQSIIDFVIIALAIFVAVKAVNHAKEAMKGEGEVEADKPVEPSEEVKLLREIRDSLKR